MASASRIGRPIRIFSAGSWSAARRPFACLLSERIWQPLGAGDAEITVDRLGASRTAGGICATIADLALLAR